jgi:hypothetical protein
MHISHRNPVLCKWRSSFSRFKFPVRETRSVFAGHTRDRNQVSEKLYSSRKWAGTGFEVSLQQYVKLGANTNPDPSFTDRWLVK